MAIATMGYDSAEFLDTPAKIAAYLAEALEDGDAAMIQEAIGIAARARGMTQIAKEAGVSRESLYRALSSNGNPSFATMVSVLNALGVKLRPEVATG